MNENSILGKVSCIIPSYRRCDTVIRAVESALNQTYKNIEVCVVDDNEPNDQSSINLQNALEKYTMDQRVRYFRQIHHKNGAAARNFGIHMATGEYIAFLDDDDEWFPTKIEEQIKILHNDDTLDMAITYWEEYENGKMIRRSHPYSVEKLQLKILMREVKVYTSTIMIRKNCVEYFGGFNEKLSRHQDLQFLIDALSVVKCALVKDYLIKHHVDSQINRPDIIQLIQIKKDFFDVIGKHLFDYSQNDRKRIMNAHYYELVFHALKSKNYSIAIHYIYKAGFCVESILDLIKRKINR